jgi:hypothetical protein
MSRHAVSWLAWSLCAFSLVLTAVSLLLLALNLSHPNTYISLIHPSAWNRNSTNFALTEFCEVWMQGAAGDSPGKSLNN